MSRNQQQGRRYFRKRNVAERYGISDRSVDRLARAGRIPPPIYLPGSRFPLWLESEFDENDRASTLRPAS